MVFIFASDNDTVNGGDGAGIGSGGNGSSAGDITISNSVISAISNWGAGIGTGYSSSAGNIKATKSLKVLDDALDYALGEATTVGSYISRLDYTKENLTTANENTQASESTIRDADMAKEMTGYTRNNILAQAAQSMLAQANHNTADVLNLLQS